MTQLAPTAVNLWDFYDTEKARPVPCDTLWRFYQFAISTDTEMIELRSVEASKGKANMCAYGPVCQNAFDIPQKGENEKFCRLTAKYEVTKEEIHDKVWGLTEEEQQMLVKAVSKKCGSTKTFCNALKLQRVV